MIGVIADDTTGANDIGSMFIRAGKSVKILSYCRTAGALDGMRTDAIIIDTDSRLDSPDVGYEKVRDATCRLLLAGCDLFFKKTASAFVGNIGCELDGMMDALRRDFCVIVAAFPDTGRTTVNGVQFIDNVPLSESEFAWDPVHPMTESRIDQIIAKQTRRTVGTIYLETVRAGAMRLREAIEAKRAAGIGYLIVDATCNNDLGVIAEATMGLTEFGGSSAMGEYLRFTATRQTIDIPDFSDRRRGVLIVSGSLMPQTHVQTRYLMRSGVKHLVLDSREMMDDGPRAALMVSAEKRAAGVLSTGKDLLIMPTDDEKLIVETKQIGRRLHLDQFQVSRRISSFSAELAHRLVRMLHLHRFVVAGGDTSGAVCRELGIQGNYIVREIEPGIPLSLSLDGEYVFVLKSGSFGSKAFLARAVEQVKG